MPKCILIVDDSYAIRSATRHFLETQTGFTVCGEATDGIDAIEKTRHLTPDLIILDLAMPRMNGLEAAGISAVVSKTDLPALQHHIEELLVAH